MSFDEFQDEMMKNVQELKKSLDVNDFTIPLFSALLVELYNLRMLTQRQQKQIDRLTEAK